MPTTPVVTTVTIKKTSSGAYAVKIHPPVARVPNNNADKDAQLIWNVSGGTFTGFHWKVGSGQPPVNVAAGKLESDVYTKNTGSTSVNWEYEFEVEVDGGPKLIIDPEVENLPPGLP